jgi:hypothetical protein
MCMLLCSRLLRLVCGDLSRPLAQANTVYTRTWEWAI